MDKKEKNDNKLLELLLKLNIKQEIKDSNFNIKVLNTRINFYQNLINDLEDNRPLFFQKKKLIEYDNKLNEYKNKINLLYKLLQDEEILLYKMYESK